MISIIDKNNTLSAKEKSRTIKKGVYFKYIGGDAHVIKKLELIF